MPRPVVALSFFMLLASTDAQRLSGTLAYPSGAGAVVSIWDTRGNGHLRIVEVRSDAQGHFDFGPRKWGAGFYQVAVGDSDRVDLILDPREQEVVVDFSGQPLQQHIQVRRSDENLRLWEYKLVSRQTQAMMTTLRAEREKTSPTDLARAHELDSLEQRVWSTQQGLLDRLIRSAPLSYFARVVSADRWLQSTMEGGPSAVAEHFDFGDPSLLRSSVYPKALAAYLQSAQPGSEREFFSEIDLLLQLAGRDTACSNYTLAFLLDLFGQYGPELAFQFVVEHHLTGREGTVPASVCDKVHALLEVAPGKTGPDVELPMPNGESVTLSQLVHGSLYLVLFFYSSTCDHCHAEMPGLRDLYAASHGAGLEIIGIALDDDSATFRMTLAEEAIPWPSFTELIGWGSPAAKAYQIKATPSLILVDSDLRIIAKPADAHELTATLAKLMPR